MSKRELWIDYTKVIACIFVVLGHFFQSMVVSNVVPSTDLYEWFNQTIYYFHVPLFFICSGYLYQKSNKVKDFESWKRNVWKKLIVLGIPYTAFSSFSWILKVIFSNEVNNKTGGFIQTLLKEPMAPYWYLYILFFMFLIVPNFQDKKQMYIGLSLAISECSVRIIRICAGRYVKKERV